VHDSALSQGEPAALAGTTEAHNVWRHRVASTRSSGTTASPTTRRTGPDHLAATNNCGLEHSSNADRANIAGFSSLGQNLAGSTGGLSGVGATTNWASERSEYDFGTPVTQGNFGAFGHYTQIVWADTTALGCGVATCGGATVVVCEYGTAGNFLGETPYGEATGECLDLDNDDILQGDDADDTAR
jgi:pathogenesis-related protein 1